MTYKKHPETADARYIGTDNGTKKFKGYIQIHLFSARRYLDDVDYGSFLNGKEIKE